MLKQWISILIVLTILVGCSDQKEHYYLTRLQAELGIASARNDLGDIYSQGLWGVDQNDKEAVRWYRMAAEQGNAEAQEVWAELERAREEQARREQVAREQQARREREASYTVGLDSLSCAGPIRGTKREVNQQIDGAMMHELMLVAAGTSRSIRSISPNSRQKMSWIAQNSFTYARERGLTPRDGYKVCVACRGRASVELKRQLRARWLLDEHNGLQSLSGMCRELIERYREGWR